MDSTIYNHISNCNDGRWFAIINCVDFSDNIFFTLRQHQFFFVVSSGLGLQINYDDTDANSYPIGLKNTAVAGAAGAGTLEVVLRHEPNKSATGVSDGDITNAGGDTDIEVTFDVTIQ